MECFRCLRTAVRARPLWRTACIQQTPSMVVTRLVQRTHTSPLSALAFRRPRISVPSSAIAPGPVGRLPPASAELDLLPKVSAHPALASIQVRNGPRNTFNPSHRVRKRRHGFLSRVRTRTGRRVLTRRKTKGRNTLSH
ncbi:hypothetical protein EJ06DRAFT_486248 [Trichodelitschia bisporula]|uniref:Large ribosomal subunit protein bL34m n=1 Tax=Trichodelitschia bisporula TaxID=703511 RepID=A0A6G1IBH7_9PEZI|nr:hypothetical protein EJ06DRAFT_486248 [Trichodelitschia bisporula]